MYKLNSELKSDRTFWFTKGHGFYGKLFPQYVETNK